jgi:hypothetical protein
MASGLTSADLAGRDASLLAPPGARLEGEHGVDEGVGHGFGGHDRSAILHRWWRVASPPTAVVVWFEERLAEDGWAPLHREDRQALFARGSEQLFVAVRAEEAGGLLYEVGYSDQSGS